MKTTYLLPCQCGEKLQVDASESGLVMKCRCGADLEVPNLRGLARLERVAVEAPPASAAAWGGAQRGIAVGAVITLLALAFAVYWTVKPLPRPRDVFDDSELTRLGMGRNEEPLTRTPAGVVELWRRVEAQGLTPGDPPLVERYHRERRIQVWWRVAGYIVAGCGLVIVLVSLAFHWSGRSRSPRRQAIAAGS